MTAQEGPALDNMAAGLIQRYSNAGVAPPKLLYVDTECCREGTLQTKVKQRFRGWPDLIVRLDIYHFMRRLASGCTKDAHPLYPTFMAKLSCCIFEWDGRDVALLRRAKRAELVQEGVPGITDQMVDHHITKAELSKHCRRQTRGEQKTITLLESLLDELLGEKGSDNLGVPLLDMERMKHIWRVQRRHVNCIQDVPGVLLYTQTGTTTKEGIVLPNFRCARGSTSLESFHLNVNRFIPGTSANSLNFQLYLLEGLNRWNQDRQAASLAGNPSSLLSYSGDLVHCANTMSLKVLGRKSVPSFQPPAVYTGELIGIDYLFRQTGRPLQDVHPDSEETEQMLEDVCLEEHGDEGFVDAVYDPTVERLDLSSDPSPSSSSTPSSLHSTASPPRPGCSSTAAASEHHLFHQPFCDYFSCCKKYFCSTTGFGFSDQGVAWPISRHHQLSLHASSSHHPLDHSPYSHRFLGITDHHPSSTWATSVDEHSIPGMDRVDCLADYLVGLRIETGLTLTNLQASTIIALWQNLLPYDRQRVEYAARHKSRLITGRFRCSKQRAEFTPGVESTTRCVLGELVLGNGVVMQDTTLQLFEVNQTTLIQWHNKRLKRQDCSILLQGVNLPPAIPIAPVPLPPMRSRPTAAPPRLGPQHQYHLPESNCSHAPLLHPHSLAPSIDSTCHTLQQERQWTRGSLLYHPNTLILQRLSAQDCLLPCTEVACSSWPPPAPTSCPKKGQLLVQGGGNRRLTFEDEKSTQHVSATSAPELLPRSPAQLRVFIGHTLMPEWPQLCQWRCFWSSHMEEI
ncbi:unnamed protein product [Pleuronectes platessa]|uniref:Uncharacterized protein n=1 Tax=Pleuronectes platessa TaxID=8262 RepID=A0A9N7VYM0_PLEPL|nr:unnamed protein product [Pleuronectes platessa]